LGHVASPTTLTPPPELDQRLLDPPHHHWRGWLTALGVLLMLLAVAGLALNWFGMLPWHGPMSQGDPGGVTATLRTEVKHTVSYASLWVYNPSRVGVVLDDVQPVNGDPALRVVNAWIPADRPACQDAATRWNASAPKDCKIPAEGFVLPSHTPVGNGPRLVVELKPMRAGTFRSPGFDIHYHVGPIHYTVTYADGFLLRTS